MKIINQKPSMYFYILIVRIILPCFRGVCSFLAQLFKKGNHLYSCALLIINSSYLTITALLSIAMHNDISDVRVTKESN